jgi:hypothetical protein
MFWVLLMHAHRLVTHALEALADSIFMVDGHSYPEDKAVYSSKMLVSTYLTIR